jgi:outer membrane protein TolC
VALSLFLALPASAGAPTGGLTADEAVRLALERRDRETRAVSRPLANVRPGDEGLLPPAVAWYADNPNVSPAQVVVGQPLGLIDGSRNARAAARSAAVRGATAAERLAAAQADAEVRTAFFALARAQWRRNVAAERVATVGAVARREQAASAGAEAEAQRDLTAADAETARARAALEALLGCPVRASVAGQLPAAARVDDPALPDEDAVVRAALRDRPELAAGEAAQDGAEARRDGERAARRLDIGPSFSGLARDRADFFPDGQGRPMSRAVTDVKPGVVFRLPVRTEAKQEPAAPVPTAEERAALEVTVRAEAVSARTRLAAALARARDLGGEPLERARRERDARLSAFERGGGDAASVLAADRAYGEAQAAYGDALADAALARAAFDRAIGDSD